MTSDARVHVEVFSGDRRVGEATRELVTSLYLESFPASERDDPNVLFEVGPLNLLMTALVGSTRPVGFASMRIFEKVDVAFLAYMAVDPASRSHGIGRVLLEGLEREVVARELKGVALEIEDPESPGATEDTRRRPSFYRRWGAREIPCLGAYYMPNFEFAGESVPMRLLYKALRDDIPRGESLKTLLAALYYSEYAEWADELLPNLLDEVIC